MTKIKSCTTPQQHDHLLKDPLMTELLQIRERRGISTNLQFSLGHTICLWDGPDRISKLDIVLAMLTLSREVACQTMAIQCTLVQWREDARFGRHQIRQRKTYLKHGNGMGTWWRYDFHHIYPYIRQALCWIKCVLPLSKDSRSPVAPFAALPQWCCHQA